ncbi:MAG: DNA-processing protein DprA [Acetobacterales bacterium]
MTAATRALSPEQRLAWLRLARTETVGPVTFRRLIERYGDAGRALEAIPELSRRGGRRQAARVPALGEAVEELEALASLDAVLIACCEPEYPRALASIEDAPPLISVRGDPSMLSRPSVGVVGARNASVSGRRLARTIAGGLGEAGFVVASGMARGIDTAAHEGALSTGTVAVLAGGVDVPYPAENEALYRQIAEQGAIVAESPPGKEPQARAFPRRNRIISGLSLGVVVVEAAVRSGSLITARMALEQGREVFAVPGSPLDSRCRGCNDLLRQGAVLTETADDVTAVLRGGTAGPLREEATSHYLPANPAAAVAIRIDDPDDRIRCSVLDALGPTPVTVDELIRECQISAPEVSAVLLELELAGRLDRLPGGRVALLS